MDKKYNFLIYEGRLDFKANKPILLSTAPIIGFNTIEEVHKFFHQNFINKQYKELVAIAEKEHFCIYGV